ncbi:MAG TPA: Ig-like domain-containing protein, partial [bacterium]|nr:Ig-like domain-containing protein [bacterium]
SDETVLVPGVDTDDKVTIVFSENTNKPTVDSSNIDSIIIPGSSHSWGEAYGTWNSSGNVLTVHFISVSSATTVAAGDTIVITSTTLVLMDVAGNICLSTASLSGSFKGIDSGVPQVLSILPQGNALGAAVSTSIVVSFSERMRFSSLSEGFGLSAVKDSGGLTIDLDVAGSISYDTATFRLTFIPQANLLNNYTYRISLSSGMTDTIGNPLEPRESFFSTILNPASENSVSTSDDLIQISLPGASYEGGFYILIDTNPLLDAPLLASRVSDANQKQIRNRDSYSVPLPGTIAEIKAFDSSGNPVSKLNSPVTVRFTYIDPSPGNTAFESGNLVFDEKSFQLHWLDETNNLWVKIPDSSCDPAADRVTARIDHFSVFSIQGSGAADLSGAHAFPVPFVPSRGDTEITFTDLSSLCTIRVFTTGGVLLKTIEHSGGEQEVWQDIDLGSGAYLFMIKNGEEIKKGKLMIVR